MKLRLVLAGLFLFGFSAFAESETPSMGAVQLDYVALDLPVKCNRLFFRSIQQYEGTIFMMPRVKASPGPDGTATYETTKNPNGPGYILSIRLYFPNSDESLLTSIASNHKQDPYSCDIDAVKGALKRANPKDIVKTIAPMPLTSVEVHIPGLGRPAVVGMLKPCGEKQSTTFDVIKYSNEVLTATGCISEEEKRYIKKRVGKSDGLPLTIKFTFNGEPRDGAITAKIDAKKLEAAFNQEIKSDQKLTKADIDFALRAALNKAENAITITSQAATSEPSQHIIESVINQILSKVDFAIKEQTKVKAESGKTSESGALLSSKTVIDIFESIARNQFRLELFGKRIVGSALMQIPLRVGTFGNTSASVVLLKAEHPETSPGFVVMRGKQLKITPIDWVVSNYFYDQEVKTYLGVDKIRELNLGPLFPTTIGNTNFIMQNREGSDEAVGIHSYFGRIPVPKEYRFLRTVRPPRIKDHASNVFSELTEEEAKKLPIGLSFGVFGGEKIFSLKQILEDRRFSDKEYFLAKFDSMEGSITLTALRDLGPVQLRQMMHKRPRTADDKDQPKAKGETRHSNELPYADVDYQKDPMPHDLVVQEEWSLLDSKPTLGKPKVLRTGNLTLTYCKHIRFSVMRPEENYNDDDDEDDQGLAPAMPSASPSPDAALLGKRTPRLEKADPRKMPPAQQQPDPKILPEFDLNQLKRN